MKRPLAKFSWLIVAMLGTTTLWYSCSKKDKEQNPSMKGSLGLSRDEIKYLEKKYAGLKIIENPTSNEGKVHFNSLNEAEETVQELEAYIDETLFVSGGEVTGSVEPDILGPVSPGFGCGDYGNYVTTQSNGSLFSSFKINFHWGPNGISSVTSSVTGLRIGWSWQQSSNQMLYPNMVCTEGIASYSSGVLNWDKVVHITWAFNPVNCTVISETASGPCTPGTPAEGGGGLDLVLVTVSSNLLPMPLPESILPVTDVERLKNNLPQFGAYISIYFNPADNKYYSDSAFTTFVPDGYYQNWTIAQFQQYHHIVNGVAINVYHLM